ncbi:MAG: FAD-binding oxidoreductase [SAR324 cluster bacterium]|nr:FAD-binding oxidoreductase [SAR324 cluster bacterium]
MTSRSKDAIVIGGGIAGASIAFRLAEKGLSVTLLEKGRVGEQASGRAGGGVRQQNRHPAELPLAMEAIKIWSRMEEELECDVGYRRNGNIRLLFTSEELEGHSRIVSRERKAGLPVEILTADEIRRRIPCISDEVELLGGKYCPSDGTANPLLVVKAICRSARRKGVEIRENEPVQKVKFGNGKVEAIVTGTAEYRADVYVNAAGSWAQGLCRLAGLNFPQKVFRAPILLTEKLPPLIGPFVSFEDLYLRQAIEGNIHLGPRSVYNSSENSFDQSSQLAEFAHSGRLVPKIFPILNQVTIIRAFAGLIHKTPDEIPILDRAPTLSNFFLAAGFSGHGFCLGPAVGKVMAEWIADGRSSIELGGLKWTRFESIYDHVSAGL